MSINFFGLHLTADPFHVLFKPSITGFCQLKTKLTFQLSLVKIVEKLWGISPLNSFIN